MHLDLCLGDPGVTQEFSFKIVKTWITPGLFKKSPGWHLDPSLGNPGVQLQIGEVLDDLKNCHGSIWTNSWVIQELSLRWPLVISSFARNSVKVTKNLFADSSHL